MRSRIIQIALLAMVTVTLVPSTSTADWDSFKQRCRLDWYRNNLWPEPFSAVDRIAVCAPFVAMTQNGWYQQSTLSNFHFNPATHELTEAGKLRVRQIVVNHPEQYRKVFVLQALSDKATVTRVDSVQQTVATMTTGKNMPEVRLVSMDPPGKAADEVDATNRLRRDTMPAPVLPEFQSTLSGGGN